MKKYAFLNENAISMVKAVVWRKLFCSGCMKTDTLNIISVCSVRSLRECKQLKCASKRNFINRKHLERTFALVMLVFLSFLWCFLSRFCL